MDRPIAHNFQFSSPPDNLDTVHARLRSIWERTEGTSLADRMSFETALMELTANVIQHSDNGFGVSYTLTVGQSAERLTAILADNGPGVELDLAEPEMPGDFAESGRGIPLVRSLVDFFEYRRIDGTNYWSVSRTLTA